MKTTIHGIEKRNGYIVFALIDRVGNMYVKNDDESISHIDDIPEHEDNLQQVSMMQNFVIDNLEYFARNGGVKHKYNYLVDDKYTSDRINVSSTVSRYPYHDLLKIMRNHEIYKKDNLFFCGSSKLLIDILPYVDSVMLTVVDYDFSDEKNIIDKFPIGEYSKFFKKKKIRTSDMAEVLKKTAQGLAPDSREVTILNDYFKMIKKVEKPKGSKHYYKFVTFTK